MLTKEDLKQIGQLFDASFDRNFGPAFDKKFSEAKPGFAAEIAIEMGNLIEQNITPQFDEVRSEMKAGFDAVDRRFDRIEGKTNTLINVLQEKNVITDADKHRILT